MDSYYTSAPLFDHLYINETIATGTYKPQMQGLPNEIVPAQCHLTMTDGNAGLVAALP